MKYIYNFFLILLLAFGLLSCNNRVDNIETIISTESDIDGNSRSVDTYLKWKHYKLGYYMSSVAAYDRDSVWLTFREKDCGVARLKEDGNIEYHLVDGWHHKFDNIDVGSSGKPIVFATSEKYVSPTYTFKSTGVIGQQWTKCAISGKLDDIGIGLYKTRGILYRISGKNDSFNYVKYRTSSNSWDQYCDKYGKPYKTDWHSRVDIDYLENEYYLNWSGHPDNQVRIIYKDGSEGRLKGNGTFLVDIAVGPYGEIYALGYDNANQYGYPIYKYNATKKSWIYVRRRAESISVDKYGTLWFVNGAGQLYRLDGVVDAGGVTLCTSKSFDYGGRRVTLGPGSYTKADLEKMKIKINTISSLAVFDKDIKLSLYSKDNFEGSCKTYTGRTYKSRLYDWDNRISSIIVERL